MIQSLIIMQGKRMGNLLIVVGMILIVMGIIFKTGWLNWFGHLPGDIRIETESMKFYFPLASMVIMSVVLSLVMYVLKR